MIHFRPVADQFIAEYQDLQLQISGQLLNENTVHIDLNGLKQKITFSRNEQALTVFSNAQNYIFEHIQPKISNEDSSSNESNLKAPMPGVITKVLVSAKDQVKKDDILLTLEAMKIEYTIRAPQDGVIAAAYFQAGDQVKAGDELVEFELLTENVA